MDRVWTPYPMTQAQIMNVTDSLRLMNVIDSLSFMDVTNSGRHFAASVL